MDLRGIPLQGKDAQLYRDGATLAALLTLAGIQKTAFAEWFGTTRVTVTKWMNTSDLSNIRYGNKAKLVNTIRALHSAVLSFDLPTFGRESWVETLERHRADERRPISSASITKSTESDLPVDVPLR